MQSIKEYRKLGFEVAKKISKVPGVKAVGYTGSMATGFIDRFSKDIDITCIVDRPIHIKERRKYLGKQDYRENEVSLFFESFKVNDIHVDLIFKDIGWIESSIKRMEPRDDFNEKQILSFLQTMKPIIDRKGIIKNLKKRSMYTDDYRLTKVVWNLSILCNRGWTIGKPIKRGDIAFINYLFSEAIEKYVSTIYALNKIYYSDLKWSLNILESLKIKPKKSIYNVKKLSVVGNNPKEINEKMRILKEMIIDLSKIIRKELPKAEIDKELKKLEDW